MSETQEQINDDPCELSTGIADKILKKVQLESKVLGIINTGIPELDFMKDLFREAQTGSTLASGQAWETIKQMFSALPYWTPSEELSTGQARKKANKKEKKKYPSQRGFDTYAVVDYLQERMNKFVNVYKMSDELGKDRATLKNCKGKIMKVLKARSCRLATNRKQLNDLAWRCYEL